MCLQMTRKLNTIDTLAVEFQATKDGRVFRKLVAALDSTIKNLIRATKHKRSHEEDLYQAAQIGIARAAELYDPTRGAFRTYAYKRIRREITSEAYALFDLMKHQGRGRGRSGRVKEAPTVELLPLDKTVDNNGFESAIHNIVPDDAPSPEDLMHGPELRAAMFAVTKTDFERYLLEYVLLGDATLQEAARTWGVTHQRVGQCTAALKVRLRKNLAGLGKELGLVKCAA